MSPVTSDTALAIDGRCFLCGIEFPGATPGCPTCARRDRVNREREDAERSKRWENEALETLRKAGIAVKVAACTTCPDVRIEPSEPCRNGDTAAHLFVSHTICESCSEAMEEARERYDSATWERPE